MKGISYALNKDVYIYLLQTYGRRPAIWLGAVSELVRTLLVRVLLGLIVAHIAASLAAGNIAQAKTATFYLFFAAAAGALIGAAGDLLAVLAENKVYQNLAIDYYVKLTGKDMAFYRDHQGGYLISLYRQHLDSMVILVRFLRGDIVKVLVSLTAPTIVLLYIDWRVGLITLAIVTLQIFYVIWSSSKANHFRAMTHEIYRKVTGEVADVITNITAFKSSGVNKQVQSTVERLTKQETHVFWLRHKTNILLDLPRDLVTSLGVTAALFVVLSTATGSPESVGLIVLTLSYMFQIIRNVSDLPTLVKQHDDLITKNYPTLKYLSTEHEAITDPSKPKKLAITKGAISIDHINFSYPSQAGDVKNVVVFRDLTIQIKGGEQVGIVGLSGAGKSTLASLLMRFDDVTGGSISIDGIDIRQVRQNDLHRHIAYVPQEPLLFHRTIRENIAYFNEAATEKDIIRAARAAHAHDFISKLPQGYDSMVGERGVKLSGGQKQRVVIARSILKQAHIMIFDEATSALDTESEQIIQRALPDIIGKHTAIVIAHRLSTIAGLDRILVMHDGDIVESGTHAQLLKAQGRYYSLWQKQVAGHDLS